MSESTLTPAMDVDIDARAARPHLVRRLLTNPSGLASAIVLAAILLVAVFADLLAPSSPFATDISNTLAPPGPEHLLGTDTAGRDVLSRLLFATRYSVAGALWAVLIGAILGVTSGLFAGYYQRWFESTSVGVMSLVQALPGIVVLLAARAVVGPSIWLIMAIFGVLMAPAFYRLTHAAVVGVRNELYVDAARVAGLGDGTIVGRHILSVVRAPIIVMAALLAGLGIAVQSALDFLGLGDASIVTWGQMLADAFSRMYQAPLLLVWPSVAMVVTSIALVLFGNAVRDELGHAKTAPSKGRRSKITDGERPVGEAALVHRADKDDASGDELLVIKDLVVGYDQADGIVKQVVKGITLTVRKGEIHGLIGESGSGKTQTAWSALQLLPDGGRITSGAVLLDGKDLTQLSAKQMMKVRGRRIAYIPQEPMSNLDPSFTIGSQLVEPMMVTLGISRNEARKRALALLARVGIPHPDRTFAAYPHEVSGGMAQRVLIAGAVSCEADLIIADEPTTALDVTVQAEILDLLRDLQRDLQVAVLIVTHNFGVVADLCDRVSVMQHGRIVETGPAESIFRNPRHPYTRSLFAAILEDGVARGPLARAADRNTTNQQGGSR